ncbi:CHAT domain-containing protein, partial [bacterium]|nr:CHAT domain-containing protein [bacterium]
SSPDTRPIPRRPAEQLRVLVAIANPANLSDYTPNGQRLTPFDAEAALAQQSLAAAQVTCLDAPGAVQLATLVQHLRDDYDVLYFMAHGQLVRGAPYLWLVQDNGNAAVTAASDLITALRDLPRPIPLVVLASCASAGAVTALAPQFAAAGAPAVIGMQGNVALDTLAQFLPVLFAELRRDGQIDRAVAAARNAIRQRNDWWMPVLYLRLHDGRLWSADDPAAPPSATISGTATVGGDNSGVNVGVNTGTISQTTQSIHNLAPNQGAQGTFNAPLTFNQPTTGSVTITGSDFSGSRNVRITGAQVGPPPQPAADPDHPPEPPDRV